ncbi:PTS transporter subunit IIC [Glaesserella sp.]|uniref:PTS transporter subunit IIC n=1 Tax=Glaesserella sp. TaxID=2094731 RepID=UPI00359FC772
MDTITQIIQTIFNLGASAILPIVIALLGIFFRMKVGEAIRSGLMVGVGFIGLTLVVQLLSKSLEPAVTHYADLGSGYTIIDVGWPAVGAASWVAPFAALSIPLGFALNLLLIRFKLTKTMNVDIWNYMHFLIPGALAYFLFDSFWLGLGITLAMSVLALFIGDLIAKRWQEYFGLEGTTCTTVIYSGWGIPIAMAVNKIIDFIPGLNKMEVSLETVNKRLGLLGVPIIIGFLVGLLLAVLTGQNLQSTITIAMGIAGVMVLMPKVVSVLMEGLSPIGKAAKEFMTKRMGSNSELNIGMDIALGLGDATTITTTVVTIPLVILCALVLPGVQLFPVGLLMSICYMSVGCTMASKGNLLRSIISTLVFSIITLYLAAWIAPGATKMLTSAGVPVSGLGTDVTFTEIWNLVIYWVYTLGN